jgi:hypothetical protein
MEKVRVKYECEILTKSATIKPTGFSCIALANIGQAPATVLNNIPLPVGGSERHFNNDPGWVIDTDFNISFHPNDGVDKQILIVKTYYEF